MTTLTLPYPPSANKYWRRHGTIIHRSKEADDYKLRVGWLCKLSSALREPYTGNVRVSFDFYRPAKRGDLDNLLKVTIDSLIGYAYVDDQQIVEIHAYRREDKAEPRVVVEVTEVQP